DAIGRWLSRPRSVGAGRDNARYAGIVTAHLEPDPAGTPASGGPDGPDALRADPASGRSAGAGTELALYRGVVAVGAVRSSGPRCADARPETRPCHHDQAHRTSQYGGGFPLAAPYRPGVYRGGAQFRLLPRRDRRYRVVRVGCGGPGSAGGPADVAR